MLKPSSLPSVRARVRDRTRRDGELIAELRGDVASLKNAVEQIRPRSAAAVSLVASDGGNSSLRFDPFSIQIVRVVDSYGKELCLEAISATTDPAELSAAQLDDGFGQPTALGRLMLDLGIDPPNLSQLSPMIPSARKRRGDRRQSTQWAKAFRDLSEWAALYQTICYTRFSGNTLVLRDGLLRTNLFADGLLDALADRIADATIRHWRQDHRRVLLAGLAKRSGVLDRYRLALAIEGTLSAGGPRYVRIPPELQQKSYLRPEWVRSRARSRFVLGEMYFVRFGARVRDPIWIVDIFSPHVDFAPEVFGYLLADSRVGFPIPLYPRSLQRAHENAQLVGFDLALLEDAVLDGVRGLLPPETPHLLDEIRLAPDFAANRYA